MIRHNIYLAARYGRHVEMQTYANQLVALGHTVVSVWIWGGHDLREDATLEENRRLAEEDKYDLALADILIYFSESNTSESGRGGRHVEFGMALDKQIQIVLIGERENVFHYLSEVTCYQTWQDFIIKLAMSEQVALA